MTVGHVQQAAVVGSGPNGLAAAVRLAQAGLPVTVYEAADTFGGGMRSVELLRPGVIHDECATILPLGIGSPFFQSLPLEQFGLEYLHPAIPVGHPLETEGVTPVLRHSLAETVELLGRDGPAYRRLVKPLVDNWDDIASEILGPPLHLPRHPVDLARFGVRALWPASLLGRVLFRDEPARALLAGNAAHAVLPPGRALTSSIALVLTALAHTSGWPVVRGGTGSLAAALSRLLESLGGRIVTGERVDTLERFGPGTLVLLDTTASEAARIAGDRFPAAYQRALLRYRQGPGVFKIDYLLEGRIPWRDEACRQAGTVHVGGTLDEVIRAEEAVARGRHPKRPFLILAQPTVADPSRAPAGQHTAWAYCHVPARSTIDMTGAIEAQIERFAPGFGRRIMARRTWGPTELERQNPNLIGGDIAGGAMSGTQLLLRPTLRRDPYATPDPFVFLCSASTPPGGGVHGMAGFHAAQRALYRHRL